MECAYSVFGKCFWIYGLNFRLPCMESRVGLNDPYGSLPAQDSDSVTLILVSYRLFQASE